MKRARSFSLLVLVLLSTHAASASDWPRVRGPNGAATSDETGLPLKWSAESASVLWKTAMPGFGASSPIHVRGRIFVTAYSGYGLDAKPAFKVLAHNVLEGDTSTFNATPAVLPGGRLVLRSDRFLYCMTGGKAATGAGSE